MMEDQDKLMAQVEAMNIIDQGAELNRELYQKLMGAVCASKPISMETMTSADRLAFIAAGNYMVAAVSQQPNTSPEKSGFAYYMMGFEIGHNFATLHGTLWPVEAPVEQEEGPGEG